MDRLGPGMRGSGVLAFRADGEPLPLNVEVVWPWDGAPHVMMTHPIRAEDGRTISYRIDLERTPCRFGGWRWWWLCPATGRRVHKLFLPRGGQRFLSRPAYRLAYASQRLDALGKLQHSKWLIIRKLGGDWDMPTRPKGMRHRTYGRLLDRLEEVELRLELCFQAGVERLVARYEKLG